MKAIHLPAPVRRYKLYALAALLLFLKTYIFYSQIQLGGFEPVFCLATLGITALFCGLLRLLSPKAAKIGFVTLYLIAGIFTAADSIYYSYVAKMPSAAQLGMAGQLLDVLDTILNLLNWKHLFMLVDLPLWFLYFVNRRKPQESTGTSHSRKESLLLFACGLFCALVVTGAGIFGQFRAEYMHNELFCYHAADFTKAALQAVNTTPVDKSLYTLKDDSDSPYFGMAEGRNVFVLQIEALQNFVIGAWYEGQELTPNLNRLLGTDTLYFPNYYYQVGGGNTADAEFSVNNSLFPPENQAAYVQYADNDYYGLPYLLKENGYSGAHVFHNYKGDFWNRRNAYPVQGFDTYTALEDFEEIDPFPMGISDRQMFTQSMEYLKSWEEPFYALYVTVSSHHPYALPLKDRHIALKPEDEATLFGLYIQSMNYVDRVLGEWLDMLKEEGLYDNSIFVLYGDHYALTNTDPLISSQVSDMLQRSYTIYDVFNVPMLIHIPGSGTAETITTAGGHMDVLPTLLCLLGIDEVRTVMFGQNLLTAESGFVCEQTHMSIGSFISDSVFFKKPHNNILSNYSVYERDTMALLSPDAFQDLSDAAAKKITDCMALMAQNDLFLP
ncbi:MAG: LTA synthase family protein [Clostridia bacterium]|nr:LTA synthase family protein [Clostridia bacterium]